MAWDSTRPVPWQRMIREWLVYVAIFTVVLLVFYRDQSFIGLLAALLVSGPLYMMIGYALAKLGYQRKTWSEMRAANEQHKQGKGAKRSRGERDADAADEAAAPRPKPAPTKRTGGGSARPGGPRKRR